MLLEQCVILGRLFGEDPAVHEPPEPAGGGGAGVDGGQAGGEGEGHAGPRAGARGLHPH